MKTEWRLSENLDLHFFPTNSPTHPRILRLSLWVTICDSPITNGSTILIYHIHSWWKCPQSVFCCVSFFSRQHGLCSLSIVSLPVISLFPLFLLCNSFLRVSVGSSCERLYKCFWFKCKTGPGNVKTRTPRLVVARLHAPVVLLLLSWILSRTLWCHSVLNLWPVGQPVSQRRHFILLDICVKFCHSYRLNSLVMVNNKTIISKCMYQI